jgi:hypothetical protein
MNIKGNIQHFLLLSINNTIFLHFEYRAYYYSYYAAIFQLKAQGFLIHMKIIWIVIFQIGLF